MCSIIISFRKATVWWKQLTREEHPRMGSKAPLFSHIPNILDVNILSKTGGIPNLIAIYKMFLSFIKVKILINSWQFFMFFWISPLPCFDWHPQFSINGLFQKKNKNKWDWGNTFFKTPTGIFRFFILPLEIAEKTKLHPSELLRPKTKSPGNSIWFFLSWPPLKIPRCS